MITATPPSKMNRLFLGNAQFAAALRKFEDSPCDEQDVSTMAPTEPSMASPTTDEVVESRSQRRHQKRKQKKRDQGSGDKAKMQFEEQASAPETHGVRTQFEFCIHDGDSDEWVSAASDEEKLKRA